MVHPPPLLRKPLSSEDHPIGVPGKGSQPVSHVLTVATPTVADLERLGKQSNRAGAAFLKADISTALTFSENALNADNPKNRERNQRSARKAYDTVLRLSKKVTLPDEDARKLQAGMRSLKAKLIRLGEQF